MQLQFKSLFERAGRELYSAHLTPASAVARGDFCPDTIFIWCDRFYNDLSLLVGRKSGLMLAAKKVPSHVTAHVATAYQSCRAWLEETRPAEPLRRLWQQQQPVVM